MVSLLFQIKMPNTRSFQLPEKSLRWKLEASDRLHIFADAWDQLLDRNQTILRIRDDYSLSQLRPVVKEIKEPLSSEFHRPGAWLWLAEEPLTFVLRTCAQVARMLSHARPTATEEHEKRRWEKWTEHRHCWDWKRFLSFVLPNFIQQVKFLKNESNNNRCLRSKNCAVER